LLATVDFSCFAEVVAAAAAAAAVMAAADAAGAVPLASCAPLASARDRRLSSLAPDAASAEAFVSLSVVSSAMMVAACGADETLSADFAATCAVPLAGVAQHCLPRSAQALQYSRRPRYGATMLKLPCTPPPATITSNATIASGARELRGLSVAARRGPRDSRGCVSRWLARLSPYRKAG